MHEWIHEYRIMNAWMNTWIKKGATRKDPLLELSLN